MMEGALRTLLAETYLPEGVEIVLHSRITSLDNQTPLDLLATDPDRVLTWAESLTGMVAT